MQGFETRDRYQILERKLPMTTAALSKPVWRVVPLLMTVVFLGHFNRIAITVVGSERLIPQYGISPTRMGLVYSAFLLMYLVGMVPAGIMADRLGPWLVLVVMLFGLAAGSVATGIAGVLVAGAPIIATLLLVRGVMGFFSAPLHPSTARTVGNWVTIERRTGANGLILSAAMVGTALTYYLFGTLIDRVAWPWAFIVLGTVTAVAGAVWLGLGGDTPSRRRAPTVVRTEPDGGSWTHLLHNRSLMLVTVAYFAVDYFEYLFFYWIQYYFGTVRELGNETSRLYSTLVTLAMAAGVASGGWIADRLVARWGRDRGRAAVPIVGMLTGSVCLALGMRAEAPIAVLAWLSVGAFAVTAAEAPCWATAIELGGKHGSTAAGIMNTGGNLGGLIAPVVTPWVGAQLGWGWAGGIGALLSLGGGLLWFGVKQQKGES